MQAARLNDGATCLAVEEVEDPQPLPGAVVLRLEASFVAPFFRELVSTNRWKTPRRPFTPGQDAIGMVETVGDGVIGHAPGDRVYCDTLLRGHGPVDQGHCFIGAFATGASGLRLQQDWPDGTFAQRVVLPAECLVPIPPDIDADPAILCRLGWLGTAWGALERAHLQPGERVAINGATGLIGTSTVLAALAMGAGSVRVIGRRRAILDELASHDHRIVIEDGRSRQDVDVVVDCVEADDPSSTERAIGMLRRGGRAVIVGGVDASISIDYGWFIGREATVTGSMWLPRGDWRRLLAQIVSGSLDLSPLRCRQFMLQEINDAIDEAVSQAGGFEHVAIVHC